VLLGTSWGTKNLGTLWGNLMGTLWDQGEKTKKSPPPPPHKEKNWTVHECMLSLPLAA